MMASGREVTSSDGTTIRWVGHGSGTSLVFVHGGLGGIDDYARLYGTLSAEVGVAAVGRRGYGFSEDGTSYSYQAEAEDILAVVGALRPPSWAMDHSSGAICTLLAAASGVLEKVVLYEPPLRVGGPVLVPERRRAAEAAIARGDEDAAIIIGLLEGVRLPGDVVAALRAGPAWDELRSRASAWIREFAEIDALTDLSWCREISAEVLLLWGSQTQPHHRHAVQELSRLLPHVSQHRFDGHGHEGPITAADQVASAVLDFLGPVTTA